METVGVRDLKTHLSRHLKRVRGGARLLVTDRGRTIAMIGPVNMPELSPEIEFIHRMVAEGRAQWSGGEAGRVVPADQAEVGAHIVRHRAGRPAVIVYLDTSSLVKLYIVEAGSDRVRALVGAAAVIATSGVTYPETRAALASRRRDRTLTPKDFLTIKATFESDWSRFVTVDVTSALCREAGQIAERYQLRGFDAVHLAAFAELVRGAGADVVRFSSFDDRLNHAAQSLARRGGRLS